MSHIELPTDSEINPADLACIQQYPPLNIYRALTIMPGVTIPWTDMIKAIYGFSFDARLREIAICRQAHVASAEYELFQHVNVAKANQVTDKELQVIMNEEIVKSLDDEANLMCAVADQMEVDATVDDVVLDELIKRYGQTQTAELLFTVSVYCTVARLTKSLRVQMEGRSPLEGEENPWEK